ncbi:MAG: hypothetical protein JJ868_04910 [Shimia sp.]|uniref:hypothetical protein n=1 Tax=Shimia sp. TaxID=1954381 RepID=UPI001B2136F2|nr:hypothetical protein [Shimia sp.]MBO6896698.1 hypothetical protein [Shimia sp.]
MQRFAIAAMAATATTPALAHSGAHLHPHAGDPVWLPIAVGTVVVGALGLLVWNLK